MTEEDRAAFQNRLNEARRRADELFRKTNLQEANILRWVGFESRIFFMKISILNLWLNLLSRYLVKNTFLCYQTISKVISSYLSSTKPWRGLLIFFWPNSTFLEAGTRSGSSKSWRVSAPPTTTPTKQRPSCWRLRPPTQCSKRIRSLMRWMLLLEWPMKRLSLTIMIQIMILTFNS